MIDSVTPQQFVEIYEKGELRDDQVVDVREPMEWEYYHLERTTQIPMNSIPEALESIPRDVPVYIVCAHGVRSETVCNYLQHRGLDKVINVEGGMAAVSGLFGFQYD